jgi:hypothetical protein
VSASGERPVGTFPGYDAALTVGTRQGSLTERLRCYYAGPDSGAYRPHCEGVGTVAYGNIVLCSNCDKMRSAVGRTQVARRLPGAELAELMAAAAGLAAAEERLARALAGARGAGASWAQVGDALGISRQAAQQRFGANAPSRRPLSGKGPGQPTVLPVRLGLSGNVDRREKPPWSRQDPLGPGDGLVERWAAE